MPSTFAISSDAVQYVFAASNHFISHTNLCREKACRLFWELIDGTRSLQYKIELAAAGMIDSHPSESGFRSARERLEDLRAHQNAFISANMRFYSAAPQEKIIRVWPASGGVIPYSTASSLKLFRPPSARRCIPGRVWVFDNLPAPVSNICACEVDISQDLLILLATNTSLG